MIAIKYIWLNSERSRFAVNNEMLLLAEKLDLRIRMAYSEL